MVNSEALNNISNTLKCNIEDIKNIEYLKVGLTNSSFKFCVLDKAYVYRQPGKNTNIFINRKSEVYSESIAKDLGLDKTIIHIDESGWKLSKYLDCVLLDPYDINDQKRAMKLIKKLHNANIVSKYDFDYLKETERFIKIFKQDNIIDFSKHLETHKQVKRINKLLDSLGYTKVLCHNDFWYCNILKEKNNRLTLIDWEYSGNTYPSFDIANFVSSIDLSIDDYLSLAKLYEGHTLTNKETKYYLYSLAIVMWYWYVWALNEELNGKIIEDTKQRYEKAIIAIDRVKDINH